MKQTVINILRNFVGIDWDGLSAAEKNTVRTACKALGITTFINKYNEVAIDWKEVK